MTFVNWLDAKVLSFFTKISHRFQRLIGRTNFFLAKVAIIIYVISVAIKVGNYWIPVLAFSTDVLLLLLSVLVVVVYFSFPMLCDKAEESVINEEKSKFFPGTRPLFRFICLIILVLGLFDGYMWLFQPKGIFLFKIIDRLGFPGFVSFLYLVEVNPLPPAKSKIREWLEAFSAGFQKLKPAKVKE